MKNAIRHHFLRLNHVIVLERNGYFVPVLSPYHVEKCNTTSFFNAFLEKKKKSQNNVVWQTLKKLKINQLKNKKNKIK
jgi:hypothetical protein